MRSRSQLLHWCLEIARSMGVASALLGSLSAYPKGAETPAEICADALSNASREVLFDRLITLETTLAGLERMHSLLPQKLVEEHNLQRLPAQLAKHRAELEKLSEALFIDEMSTGLTKSIRDLAYDIEHDRESANLWSSRVEQQTFSEIIHNPRSLMYGRLYQIDAERGDHLQVRFARPLVEQFYWESRDATRKEAAHASLIGIGRGIRPATSNAASGIDFLGEVEGYQVVKIQIVGHHIGAYRVYGCLLNGIFEFVLWEHEGTHDHRYIRRVTHKTVDLCKRI